MEVLFYPILPDLRKSNAFLEGSQGLHFCLSGTTNVYMKINE